MFHGQLWNCQLGNSFRNEQVSERQHTVICIRKEHLCPWNAVSLNILTFSYLLNLSTNSNFYHHTININLDSTIDIEINIWLKVCQAFNKQKRNEWNLTSNQALEAYGNIQLEDQVEQTCWTTCIVQTNFLSDQPTYIWHTFVCSSTNLHLIYTCL